MWTQNSQFSVTCQGTQPQGEDQSPHELCVTTLKPDIVILDYKEKKNLHIFELTCPGEIYIEKRHLEKSNKYAHFTTDITDYTCTVSCFEVSSKGFLTTRNHTTLNKLHSFIKPGTTKTQFKSNIHTLSLTASHHIFICRNDPTFLAPPYLLPPLVARSRGPGYCLIAIM